MFRPLIALRCPRDIFTPIQEGLSEACPHDLSASFGEASAQTLSLKPRYEWTDAPRNVDSLDSAPHLVVYFFSCPGRSSLPSDEKRRLSEFSKANARPHCPMVPVLAHTDRWRALFAKVQRRFASLQSLTITVNGAAKKSDLAKLWQFFTEQIVRAVQCRIESMRVAATAAPSIDAFRASLRLAALYDSISFHKRVSELMTASMELVDRNRRIFPGFLSEQSLQYSFDFSRSCDDIDRSIAALVPSEFDMRFVFFKHNVQALTLLDRPVVLIQYAFSFLMAIVDRVKEDPAVTPWDYELWLVRAVSDLMTVCQREWEMERTESNLLFASVLELFIDHLPILRRLFVEQKREETDSPFVSKYIATESKYESEMQRVLHMLMNIYEALRFRRKFAMTGQKLAAFAGESTQQLLTLYTMTLIHGYSSFLVGDDLFSHISGLGFREEFETLAKILWDKRAQSHQLKAAERLSVMMKDPEWNDVLLVNILVSFELIERDLPELISQEAIYLPVRFICGFKGELVCPALWLSWYSNEIQSVAHFSVHDFRLYDGVTARLLGHFDVSCTYLPHAISIQIGKGSLRTNLPHNTISVHAGLPPVPVTLAVQIPGFLLPFRWQIALIKLTVMRKLPKLELTVSGLAFRPAPLIQNNRVTSESENGLAFSNVSEGTYELCLPIRPGRTSGVIRIEAWHKVMFEGPFTVSNYLEMKLVCRVSTKVAQLAAWVTKPCVIEITGVTFNSQSNEAIEAQAIGLPMQVGMTTESALFILETVPASALIFVQQLGLQPFSLYLNVEKLEEEALVEAEIEPATPMSSLVPAGYNL